MRTALQQLDPPASSPSRAAPAWFVSLARAGVFLAVALSGFVFSEPAPVDLVLLCLIVIVPLAGLTRPTPGITSQFLLLLGCAAGAFIATSLSQDLDVSARHAGVSLYLYVAFLVLASFIAQDGARHTRLVMNAWIVAGLLAAVAALAGYFDAFPGAQELFTKFGRATGTFKDPNVFAPFLVPPILYLANRAFDRDERSGAVAIAIMVVLVSGVVLSFSRGAWLNLLVGGLLYGFLRFGVEASPKERLRLLLIAALGLLIATAGIIALLHLDQVAALLRERASVTQSYDVGPEGRFGGQLKALSLLTSHPLGIGAGEFTEHFHPEDVHNVYLSMFLNAGWIGGLLYLTSVLATIIAGFVHIARPSPTRTIFIAAYASFVATALEGAIIDTDHWRQFYFLMALLWGMIGAGEAAIRAVSKTPETSPRQPRRPGWGPLLVLLAAVIIWPVVLIFTDTEQFPEAMAAGFAAVALGLPILNAIARRSGYQSVAASPSPVRLMAPRRRPRAPRIVMPEPCQHCGRMPQRTRRPQRILWRQPPHSSLAHILVRTRIQKGRPGHRRQPRIISLH